MSSLRKGVRWNICNSHKNFISNQVVCELLISKITTIFDKEQIQFILCLHSLWECFCQGTQNKN